MGRDVSRFTPKGFRRSRHVLAAKRSFTTLSAVFLQYFSIFFVANSTSIPFEIVDVDVSDFVERLRLDPGGTSPRRNFLVDDLVLSVGVSRNNFDFIELPEPFEQRMRILAATEHGLWGLLSLLATRATAREPKPTLNGEDQEAAHYRWR